MSEDYYFIVAIDDKYFSHAGFGLYNPKTSETKIYGFHPDRETFKGKFLQVIGKGDIKNETKRDWAYKKRYKITQSQYNKALLWYNEFSKRNPKYFIFDYLEGGRLNCTVVVYEIAKAIGLNDIPRKVYPKDLYESVSGKKVSGCDLTKILENPDKYVCVSDKSKPFHPQHIETNPNYRKPSF